MRLPRLLTSPCVVQLNCPSVYQWVTLGPMVSYLEKGIAPDRTIEQMAIHPGLCRLRPKATLRDWLLLGLAERIVQEVTSLLASVGPLQRRPQLSPS